MLARAKKSSTAGTSVKRPTCGRSVEASPRMTGASSAARARRSASGSGSIAGDHGAERVGAAWASGYRWAVAMISSDFASHSSLVSAHAVMP